MKNVKRFVPDGTMPVHLLLREYLRDRGWSKGQFCFYSGNSKIILNKIIAGTHRITVPMALKLQSALGVTAETWLTLQMKHDLYLARKRKRHG